jgi:DNA-binding transcriptional LysR family regulator
MACQLAIDGDGIAVFDRLSARGLDLSAAIFRPLEPPRWIAFGYVHHSDQTLSANANKLIECVLRTLADFRNQSAENAAAVELVSDELSADE